MPKKIITLYIEDNEIKLLVANGKAVERNLVMVSSTLGMGRCGRVA